MEILITLIIVSLTLTIITLFLLNSAISFHSKKRMKEVKVKVKIITPDDEYDIWMKEYLHSN